MSVLCPEHYKLVCGPCAERLLPPEGRLARAYATMIEACQKFFLTPNPQLVPS